MGGIGSYFQDRFQQSQQSLPPNLQAEQDQTGAMGQGAPPMQGGGMYAGGSPGFYQPGGGGRGYMGGGGYGNWPGYGMGGAPGRFGGSGFGGFPGGFYGGMYGGGMHGSYGFPMGNAYGPGSYNPYGAGQMGYGGGSGMYGGPWRPMSSFQGMAQQSMGGMPTQPYEQYQPRNPYPGTAANPIKQPQIKIPSHFQRNQNPRPGSQAFMDQRGAR